MSDFHIIQRVNSALRVLLFDSFSAEPELSPIINQPNAISFESPKQAVSSSNNRLSVFLYHLNEDPNLKNRPSVRTDTVGQLRPPPMALRLHYLFTPIAPTPEANALIIGKILETLYDHSTLPISDPMTGQTEDLRLIFETLNIGDLAEVWEALEEPYRVSLAYQVRVPVLESRREIRATPVGESQRSYYGATS